MGKKIATKEELSSIVEKRLETTMEELINKIHRIAQTKSGDIEPVQVLEKEEIFKQLVPLIVQQVWQNME